jgi:hypothetical protein
MKLFLLCVSLTGIVLMQGTITRAQVAITTDGSSPDASAMLDVKSTSRGLLVPRMTQVQRLAISSPANGLLVYQTDNTQGYYFNIGTSVAPSWLRMGDLVLPYSGTGSFGGYAFQVTNSSGNGMYVETAGTNTWGIFGKSSSAGSLISYGVVGETMSSTGCGVYGNAPSSTGYTVGVLGVTNSTTGIGVKGYTWPSTGVNFGVYGESSSSNGIGVYGNGSAYALEGETSAASGYGLEVLCTHPTGYTRGVSVSMTSPNGFSGYFGGGKTFYVGANVGIGTVSPDCQLVINAPDLTSRPMLLCKNGDGDIRVQLRQTSNGSGALYLYDITNTATVFLYGNGSSYINSGNFGIGTTSPAYLLQVGVAGDGTQARANAWNLLSDARLKRDFTGFTDPLGMVGELKGYYFYWNTGKDKTRQVGFSAQEVQKVIPEVVSEGEDGYLSIEYGKMAPLLVEAIKELNAKVEALEKEVAELKGK